MNILKWFLGVLGGILLVLMIVVAAQMAFSEKKPAPEPAPDVSDQSDQSAPIIINDTATAKSESDLAAEVTKPKPAQTPAVDIEATIEKAVAAAIAKAAPAPASATTPVERPASATNPAPGAISVSEFEELNRKLSRGHNDHVVESKNDEEFRRLFKGWGEPRTCPDPGVGTVSYVLLHGGPSSPDGTFCMGDRPPLAVPTGFRDIVPDSLGRWMAVK